MTKKPFPLQLHVRTDRRKGADRRATRYGGRRETDARRWATNADLFAASTGVLLPWRGPNREQSSALDTTN